MHAPYAYIIETRSKDSIFLINIPFVYTMQEKAVFIIEFSLVIAKYLIIQSKKDELCKSDVILLYIS